MKTKYEKYRGILSVAIPTVISYLFLYVENVLDMKMVSKIRPEAMAAVYVTLNPNIFLQALPTAIATVMVILIPYYLSKGEKDRANRAMLAGITIATIYGLLISIISFFNSHLFIELSNAEASIQTEAEIYFRTLAGLSVIPAFSTVACGVMQGTGRPRILVYCSLISGVVNLLFDYLLIEGHFGFPQLGIKGAAIATNISRIVYLMIPLVILLTPKCEVSLIYCFVNKIRLARESISEIFDNGIAIFGENIANRIGLILVARIASGIGVKQFTVYSVGVGVLSFSFALAMGLQTGAIAELSRVMGDENIENRLRMRENIYNITKILNIGIAVVFVIFAYPYFRFYFDDISLVKIGLFSTVFLIFVSMAQISQIIISGILKVYGETNYSMYSGILCVVIINPLVSFLLVKTIGLGLWGVWAAGLIAQTTRATLVYIKEKKVFSMNPWGRG